MIQQIIDAVATKQAAMRLVGMEIDIEVLVDRDCWERIHRDHQMLIGYYPITAWDEINREWVASPSFIISPCDDVAGWGIRSHEVVY